MAGLTWSAGLPGLPVRVARPPLAPPLPVPGGAVPLVGGPLPALAPPPATPPATPPSAQVEEELGGGLLEGKTRGNIRPSVTRTT